MPQIPGSTLNVCLCSSVLEGKMEFFKELLLLRCSLVWLQAVPLSTQKLQLDICATQPSFLHIRQFYPFSTTKTDVLPAQGKRGFSSLSLRFHQSQHSISNFTSCKGQPKIPQTRLLWKRWKIRNFCEKPH